MTNYSFQNSLTVIYNHDSLEVLNTWIQLCFQCFFFFSSDVHHKKSPNFDSFLIILKMLTMIFKINIKNDS